MPAAAAGRVDGTSDGSGSGSAAAPLEPPEVRLRRLEEDSKRLVLLPALAFVLLLAMASASRAR